MCFWINKQNFHYKKAQVSKNDKKNNVQEKIKVEYNKQQNKSSISHICYSHLGMETFEVTEFSA